MKSRKIRAFVLILLTVLTITTIMAPNQSSKAQAATSGYGGKIWKGAVKLKASRSSSSKTLTKVSNGKKVVVYGTFGSWRKVSYKGKTGFVPKSHVYIFTSAPSLKGNTAEEKGKIVASFAKRFKGNTYRYGRTSLNGGTDCSGFVGSVYRSFGYRLPRSSSGQRSVGRKVSRKTMRAGDIVCYSGHVALYIGGGRIVHASNRKTGIKISNRYNYRRIVSIRRVVK